MASDRTLLKNVAVATDFSPGAAAAIRRAAWLPIGPGGTLSIVHALADSIPVDFRDAVAERAMVMLHAAAADVARAIADRGANVKVEYAVVLGTPYVEIIRHARATGADLVVIGRHGPRALRDAFLGSTAERVVRKGDVPVLLVNEKAAGPYQRALVAIDLSDASRRVTDLALTLLPDDVRSLRMVHAFHIAFEDWFAANTLDEYRRQHQDLAAANAQTIAAAYTERGIQCELTVSEGDPRIVVLREAVRERCDLMAVGTHARSGMAHALLGSVAEWLVRSSPCDVALARPTRFTFEMP